MDTYKILYNDSHELFEFVQICTGKKFNIHIFSILKINIFNEIISSDNNKEGLPVL